MGGRDVKQHRRPPQEPERRPVAGRQLAIDFRQHDDPHSRAQDERPPLPQQQLEMTAQLVAELRALRLAIQDQNRAPHKNNAPLTREQAAGYLGVHKDTLYRWAVEEGRIAYSRLGDGAKAALRFNKKDIDDFLGRNRIPTVEETRARTS